MLYELPGQVCEGESKAEKNSKLEYDVNSTLSPQQSRCASKLSSKCPFWDSRPTLASVILNSRKFREHARASLLQTLSTSDHIISSERPCNLASGSGTD
jgi:hypothetical protein